MKNIFFIAVYAITLFASPLFAEKINVSGYGAAGFNARNTNFLNGTPQETYYEGKIQTDIKFSDYIEAQVDFRGNSYENSVKLREFSVKFDVSQYLKLKIGNLKKPFNNEYMINKEDLLSIDRSYSQQKIAEHGYGGRSVSMMAYHKYKKENDLPISYNFSIFKDNGLNQGFFSRFLYHPDKHFAFGMHYSMVFRTGSNSMRTEGIGLEFLYERKALNLGLEMSIIQDPEEMILNKKRGLEEKAHALATQIMASYSFKCKYKFLKKIEPIIISSFYWDDMDDRNHNVMQIMPGINFHLHKKVVVRLNGDLLLTQTIDNETPSMEGSQGKLQIMVKF